MWNIAWSLPFLQSFFAAQWHQVPKGSLIQYQFTGRSGSSSTSNSSRRSSGGGGGGGGVPATSAGNGSGSANNRGSKGSNAGWSSGSPSGLIPVSGTAPVVPEAMREASPARLGGHESDQQVCTLVGKAVLSRSVVWLKGLLFGISSISPSLFFKLASNST